MFQEDTFVKILLYKFHISTWSRLSSRVLPVSEETHRALVIFQENRFSFEPGCARKTIRYIYHGRGQQ